ncbi:MAG: tetratricopeptide repeat protein [Spirochaetota bacterium]|nr:MAG: tetratricopeptide repeat protein [Spirochaetota bacterium]
MRDYRYSRYLYKPKKKKKKLFLVLFLLILLGGGIFYSVFFLNIYMLYSKVVEFYRVRFNDYTFLEKNLESGNYNIVVHEGLPYLVKSPYNARLLRYIGEAYYYISSDLTGNEKEESVERAIFYIRKGIVLSNFDDVLTKSYYILGMAYFRKGEQNYELATQYLGLALENGYEDDTIFEIMGYCYYKLGVLDEAIKYLEKTVALTDKDVGHLFLAYAYKDKGMYESAVQELNNLVNKTSDHAILEEAYEALAWIDFQEERYEQARAHLYMVLELNEKSAEAYFLLGNIHEIEGDMISARKEWRRVLSIDPKHIGAIDKLY